MWYLKLQELLKQEEAGEEGDNGGAAGAGGQEGDEGLPPEGGEQKRPWRGWDFDDDIKEHIAFDPFSPKSKEEEDDDEQEGGKAADEKGGEEEEGKPGEEGKKAEGEQKKGEGDVEQLKAQLKQATDLISQYQALMEKQTRGEGEGEGEGKGKGEEGKGKEGPDIPKYAPFKIPKEIQDMIFSEDRGQLEQGLGLMLQGVAQITHMRVREEMEERFKKFSEEEVPKKQRELTEADKAKDTQDKIRKDWVESYPDLAGEELKPLVAQVASMVANETGAREWNGELRDKIAARVRKILGRSDDGKKQEEGGQQGKKKPPFASSGSNRQGAPAKVDPMLKDISDTLDLG